MATERSIFKIMAVIALMFAFGGFVIALLGQQIETSEITFVEPDNDTIFVQLPKFGLLANFTLYVSPYFKNINPFTSYTSVSGGGIATIYSDNEYIIYDDRFGAFPPGIVVLNTSLKNVSVANLTDFQTAINRVTADDSFIYGITTTGDVQIYNRSDFTGYKNLTNADIRFGGDIFDVSSDNISAFMVGTDNHIYAYNISSLFTNWSLMLGFAFDTNKVTYDDYYVYGGSQNGRINKYNKTNFTRLATYDFIPPQAILSMTTHANKLYVLTTTSRINIFDNNLSNIANITLDASKNNIKVDDEYITVAPPLFVYNTTTHEPITIINYSNEGGLSLTNDYIISGRSNILVIYNKSDIPNYINAPLNDVWFRVGEDEYANSYFKANYLDANLSIGLPNTRFSYILNNSCNCTACADNGNSCSIPIYIKSDNFGILNYTYTVNYTYGIDNCSTFPNIVTNISYFNELNNSPVQATNDYILHVSNPFTQEYAGYFSADSDAQICTNVNLTARGLTYDIYGSMTIAANAYKTKIITNAEASPYIVETSPFYSLPVYMVATGNGSTVEFTLKDSVTRNTLPGVNIKMYQYILGVPSLVNQKQTDITGKAVFDYIEDKQYLLNFSKPGYTTLSSTFNPITSKTYDVFLAALTIFNTSEPLSRVIIRPEPSIYYPGTNNFTLDFYSPYSEFNNYSLALAWPGGNYADSGNTAAGEIFTGSFIIVAPSQFDTVKLTINYNTDLTGEQQLIYQYPIQAAIGNNTMMANKGETYGLGLFERLFIAVFIVLLIIGLAALMGQIAPGAFIGFVTFGYLVYIGFIPLWSILITMFVGVLLIAGRTE